jgi:hypothetical protein
MTRPLVRPVFDPLEYPPLPLLVRPAPPAPAPPPPRVAPPAPPPVPEPPPWMGPRPGWTPIPPAPTVDPVGNQWERSDYVYAALLAAGGVAVVGVGVALVAKVTPLLAVLAVLAVVPLVVRATRPRPRVAHLVTTAPVMFRRTTAVCGSAVPPDAREVSPDAGPKCPTCSEWEDQR